MKNSSSKSRASTLHIFGGGALISLAEEIALEKGWQVVVRTGRRLLDSIPRLHQETPVLVGDDLRSLLSEGFAPKAGDIGISISAPWIISQEVVDLFSGNIFNLHQQALPRYRGAGGTSWLVLMNERKGGCCIHRLVRKVDAGEIYAREDVVFPVELKYPEQFDRTLAAASRSLLGRWLPGLLASGQPGKALPVEEAMSEYWPRLNTEIHGWIDWAWGLKDIETFCRAFSFPHSGAKTSLPACDRVSFHVVEAIPVAGKFHPFQTGLIFRIDDQGGLHIAHPDGVLLVKEYSLEPDARRPRLGDRFHTSAEHLEQAMRRRIQYLPSGEIVDN